MATSCALLISQGRVGLHLYLSAAQSLSEVGVVTALFLKT